MVNLHRTLSRTLCIALCCATAAVSGCGRPNQANILLRQQIQQMEAELETLRRQRQGDLATMRALQQQQPTVATLPPDRLEDLFTTHGLRLGRLTSGANLDPMRPGDEGITVHAVPIDQRGDLLKAAGAFIIEAFDLSRPDDPRLGRWQFTPEQAAEHWLAGMLMYGYSFNLEWQRPPQGTQVTVRVTFSDALTGREFTEQRVVDVDPPAAPATVPPSGS
jgi:hypothetical protein